MILVDYNNLSSACFLVDVQMQQDMDFFRHVLITKILAVKKQFGKTHGKILICADGPNSWRKEYFPYYKARRKLTKEQDAKKWETLGIFQKTVLQEFREYLPWRVVQEVPRAEGDDVIGVLIHHGLGSNRPFAKKQLIASDDKDFRQLLSYPNVQMYRTVKKDFYSVEDSEAFLKDHILRGDAGDDIPNVRSQDDFFIVGTGKQKPITKKFIEDFSVKTADEETLQRYARNRKLIDLREIPSDIVREILDSIPDENMNVDLMKYCLDKGLNTLLERINEFK